MDYCCQGSDHIWELVCPYDRNGYPKITEKRLLSEGIWKTTNETKEKKHVQKDVTHEQDGSLQGLLLSTAFSSG